MEELKDITGPIFDINPLFGVNLTAITQRSADGSYVITKDGLPYHVPNSEGYKKLFAAVHEYAKTHPEVVKVEHPYVPTAEELAEQELAKAKAARAAAVAALTVEVDGMVFDGDETAQERMARTVTAATATGEGMDATTTWVLHDNTVAQVSIRQLATALRMAGEAQTALWVVPYQN